MVFMITYLCREGCSYCAVDAVSPNGQHMSDEIFSAALRLRVLLGDPWVALSGGEPFEHPQAMRLVKEAWRSGAHVALTTNGIRLGLEQHLRKAVLRHARQRQRPLIVQITNHRRILMHPDLLQGDFIVLSPPMELFPSAKAVAAYECGAITLPGQRLDRGRFRYCEHLRRSKNDVELCLSDLVKQYTSYARGVGGRCSLYVHPDGAVRAGFNSDCQHLGWVQDVVVNFEKWNVDAARLLRSNCALCSRRAAQTKARRGHAIDSRSTSDYFATLT